MLSARNCEDEEPGEEWSKFAQLKVRRQHYDIESGFGAGAPRPRDESLREKSALAQIHHVNVDAEPGVMSEVILATNPDIRMRPM